MTDGRVSHTDEYSPLLSLITVFLAFTILAALLCCTVPAFRYLTELPINENALSYDFDGFGWLLADSLLLSLKELAVILALFLCAFSIFCDTVISVITAINGFCCGSVLFYSLIRIQDHKELAVYLIFYAFGCALSLLFASVCIKAHKALLTQERTALLFTAVKLLFTLITFGGALCLTKLTQLLLL